MSETTTPTQPQPDAPVETPERDEPLEPGQTPPQPQPPQPEPQPEPEGPEQEYSQALYDELKAMSGYTHGGRLT